jgi:DNA invertase Pin-like site-specific DNA recombinase
MKGKKVGCYCRVSTVKQDTGLASQVDGIGEWLDGHGLSKRAEFYNDKMSGKDMDRPAWKKLQKDIFMGKIDTVVVWKIDRIGRNLREGINAICDLLDKGVRLVSVSQQFDFSGPTGKLIASLLLGIAEMERNGIRENVVRGLQKARKDGKRLGRPATLDPAQIAKDRAAGLSVQKIAEKYGVSRQAIYAHR